ncbi:MAG: hypothetical protein ABI333_21590 [bacterium]
MTRTRHALHLALPVIGGALLLAASTPLHGCGKKSPEEKLGKVDCDTLCNRTFGTCAEQVFVASGKMQEGKVKLFKKLKILPRVKKEGLDNCLKGCRKQGGRGGDAMAINACLALDDCKRYASCIVKHIK